MPLVLMWGPAAFAGTKWARFLHLCALPILPLTVAKTGPVKYLLHAFVKIKTNLLTLVRWSLVKKYTRTVRLKPHAIVTSYIYTRGYRRH